ncbi:MAG: electron transport complex subunit RsxD, partial [Gammaproteobacteria bacterium]|nr:electron transport complex subunit RsxD [Gammaproteobacteria bacterium]
MNSNQIMTRTGMALIPGFLASVWVFGLGILLNVAAALLAALVLEMAYHQVRRRPQTQASLSSGLLAAVLLALCLPPMLPFGLVVFGVAFALIFGKFVYGGLGQNLFNPAMVGYGGLILSSPLLMTQWLPESGVTPSTLDLFRIKIGLQSLDGYTGATALDLLRNRQGMTLSEYWQLAEPVFNDQILISLGYLLGGIYLIQARIISFKLPLAMLIG